MLKELEPDEAPRLLFAARAVIKYDCYLLCYGPYIGLWLFIEPRALWKRVEGPQLQRCKCSYMDFKLLPPIRHVDFFPSQFYRTITLTFTNVRSMTLSLFKHSQWLSESERVVVEPASRSSEIVQSAALHVLLKYLNAYERK